MSDTPPKASIYGLTSIFSCKLETNKSGENDQRQVCNKEDVEMSAFFHSSRRIGLRTQIQPEVLIQCLISVVDYNIIYPHYIVWLASEGAGPPLNPHAVRRRVGDESQCINL